MSCKRMTSKVYHQVQKKYAHNEWYTIPGVRGQQGRGKGVGQVFSCPFLFLWAF